MRKQVVKTSTVAMAAALMVIGAVSSARAEGAIVAKVPFAFIVGDVRLPAGNYTVKEVSDDSSGVVAIASVDGRQFVYALTIPASVQETADQPELAFEKVGNEYFLSRISSEDGNPREIPLTAATLERELIVNATNASE